MVFKTRHRFFGTEQNKRKAHRDGSLCWVTDLNGKTLTSHRFDSVAQAGQWMSKPTANFPTNK